MSGYPGGFGQQQGYAGAGGYGGGGFGGAYGAGGAFAGGAAYGQGGGGYGYGGAAGGASFGGSGSFGGGGGGGGGDRAQRSVFVGNIPYKASENDLIQLFSQVGPVLSFRLVTDRDTGRPKGYGFCEYADVGSATNALHTLNGYEFQGRQLRVDKSKGA